MPGRQAVGNFLYSIFEPATHLTAVAQKLFKWGMVLRRSNDEDLFDACHHDTDSG